ncbi:hypothetical protein IHV25_07810 [Phaeovibrio sulfidiphilus]|uniref:Oxaloacetate decarboxylase, gamma chain n=1 Tax=Phaeovibrio sulfidiphilus TaxID=1220600 RepID=A0A8J6YQM8_9PROT|nr:hypothetical protein [Phaeovibrio sulfidiphilus]MBE1237552.1 hypothetical protein [Phaeovibrio sulfidiphilus]
MTLEPVLFSLKVYGLVIVISFFCAAVIRLIVLVLSSQAERSRAREAARDAAGAGARAGGPDAPGPAAAPAVCCAGGDIPPEHVAIIAAAVHALGFDGPVVQISEPRPREGWVSAGRFALHSSHNVFKGRQR